MIFHQAFFREVLTKTGVISILLISIFIILRGTVYLGLVANGTLTTAGIWTIIMLRALSHLDIITPLAIYVAMLMVLRRWVQDSELVVVFASGISLSSFLRPTLSLFLVFGILTGALSFYISPLALRAGDKLEHEYRTSDKFSGIVPGIFIENFGGTGVYYVEGYSSENNRYNNLFSWTGDGITDSILTAEYAIKETDPETHTTILTLKNGMRFNNKAGDSTHEKIEFESYGILIQDGPIPQTRTRLASISTFELLEPPRNMVPEFISEFHWRISKVILLPLGMLIALAFGVPHNREDRLAPFLTALFIYIAYAFIVGYIVTLARRGAIESLFILWAIHLTFFALAAYQFRMRCRNKSLLPFSEY